MRRLSNCVIKFRHMETRRIGEGFGGYLKKDVNPISVCDDEKAVQAHRSKVNDKKPSLALASLDMSMPRDMMMYK